MRMYDHKIYRTGFEEQLFEIDCNNEDAYGLTSFLFTDFPGSTSINQPIKYDIISVGINVTGPLAHVEACTVMSPRKRGSRFFNHIHTLYTNVGIAWFYVLPNLPRIAL